MADLRSKQAGSYVALALVGAAVATFGDALHVHTRTLSYPEPFMFGQAVFVFPGFVGAFLTMGVAYSGFVTRLPATVVRAYSASPGNLRDLVESLTAFLLVYLLSGFGNREPLLLAVVFYATAFVRIAVSPDRGFMALLAVTLAVGGVAAEGTMVQLHLVNYRQPELYGVPFWLGALYMHGAFGLRDGMRWFVYRGDRPVARNKNGGGGGI